MIDVDLFDKDMRKISDELSKPRKTCGIDLNITKECNFRCTYCYEGDSVCFSKDDIGDSLDSVFNLIDDLLVDEWFLNKFNSVKIGLWGGEPTLRPDILKRIVDKYRDNSMVGYLIYTNGHDITEFMEIFEPVKDLIDVQVSYDGGYIHRKNRPDIHGNATNDLCKKSMKSLYDSGFRLSIKSTIDPRDDFPHMLGAWEDIKSLYDEFGKCITYSITPDNIRNSKFDMDLFKKTIKSIAKREIEFYKENGHHLMSWFGGEKVKCVFFESGFFVDTNGDLMHCHGCGYHDDTSEFVFGNINDDGVIDEIRGNMDRFKTPEIKACNECVSTICLCCNSAKYINSSKTNFIDKWYDFTCQKNHCELFREFGKIDRAVKEILGR